VLSTREYPPEQLARFDDAQPPVRDQAPPARGPGLAIALLAIGLAGVAAIRQFALDRQLYVLAGGLAAVGALFLLARRARPERMFAGIMRDLQAMPG
ncbi:hypothetical protein NYZ10_19495, partial [Acinetobacter baumannii]|nr:hypothetical protein [Acinetobacter baumannii]